MLVCMRSAIGTAMSGCSDVTAAVYSGTVTLRKPVDVNMEMYLAPLPRGVVTAGQRLAARTVIRSWGRAVKACNLFLSAGVLKMGGTFFSMTKHV